MSRNGSISICQLNCAIYVIACLQLLGAGGASVEGSLTTDAVSTQRQHRQVATSAKTTKWQAAFIPKELEVHMGTQAQVFLEIRIDASAVSVGSSFHVRSENLRLASVPDDYQIIPTSSFNPITDTWSGNISADALFLGFTRIYVQLIDPLAQTNTTQPIEDRLRLTIVRKMRIIDHVFTASVALFVSLLYINFGAALDLTVLRGLISRPVGPVIAFMTQFIMMPVLSYVLGYLIFPDSVEMQLGLFFTGVSPSGGASNIWAVILGGNINLSVLMTAISNFAAFGMMPLWLFTLGNVIFERGDMRVPYTNIATFAVALVVPLAIGLAIQKWLPRVTRILVRLLKPISTCLIIFIIVFAIVTNLYLFELFSWQIVVAGLALPWLGYILAWFVAKALRQNAVDSLTIAIETGIQNTGIAIFLLRFSLPQPQADLTTVIPVSVAIMTPLPLLGIYIYKRFTDRSIKYGVTENESSTDHHIS